MNDDINLFVREDGIPVEAPDRDLQVARGYNQWPDKGEVVDGIRITILVDKTEYAVDEEVRVLHVLEVVEAGRPIFVMGPKPVFDEYLDGEIYGNPSRQDDGDPFVPDIYNGRVREGPGLDFNFEITSLRFSGPGNHRFRWCPGQWESNVLHIVVR